MRRWNWKWREPPCHSFNEKFNLDVFHKGQLMSAYLWQDTDEMNAFLTLCNEVLHATGFISSYEECCPHYQRVLDYIIIHLDEREDMSKVLSQLVTDGGYNQIALVQFLMESLKWPEIRVVAEARCAKEGNMYWEVKHLIDVYNPVG